MSDFYQTSTTVL